MIMSERGLEVKSIEISRHSRYIGEVYGELPNGVGIFMQIDGLKYEGNFRHGEMTGFGLGTHTESKSIVKSGYWRNGELWQVRDPSDPAIQQAVSEARAVVKLWEEHNKREKEPEHLYDADPNCEHVIVPGDNYSGIKCSKCKGWFCL